MPPFTSPHANVPLKQAPPPRRYVAGASPLHPGTFSSDNMKQNVQLNGNSGALNEHFSDTVTKWKKTHLAACCAPQLCTAEDDCDWFKEMQTSLGAFSLFLAGWWCVLHWHKAAGSSGCADYVTHRWNWTLKNMEELTSGHLVDRQLLRSSRCEQACGSYPRIKPRAKTPLLVLFSRGFHSIRHKQQIADNARQRRGVRPRWSGTKPEPESEVTENMTMYQA